MTDSHHHQPPTNNLPPVPRIALAVAIALRLAVPLIAWVCGTAPTFFHEPDTKAYLLISQSLLESGRFERAGEPEVFRTPGYPVLLLTAVALDRVEIVTIALQIALSIGTVLLAYRLAWALYQRRDIASAAAWFAACEPSAILYASKLLTETLFTFLFLAGLYLVVCYLQGGRARTLLAAGVCFAAATYTRPVGYYFALFVALLLLARLFLERELFSRRSLPAFAYLLLVVALIVPWQVRNHQQTGYAGFSSWPVNALTYYSSIVRQREPGDSLIAAMSRARFLDDVEFREAHPEQAPWTPAQRFAAQEEAAWPAFRAAPGSTFRVYLQGVAATMTDNGMTIVQGLAGPLLPHDDDAAAKAPLGHLGRVGRALVRRPAFVLIYAMLQAILLGYIGFAVWGLVANRNHGRWEALLLLAAALYLLLVSGGPFGSHRMRVPIMPLISTFAAAGLCHVKAIVERRRARRE
ncbi:MAG: glycosyltransferase family 39 protein [Pirellulales bacterium]|nr:glycosyltransferase family 39 protein [Pirellulales bacterium]